MNNPLVLADRLSALSDTPLVDEKSVTHEVGKDMLSAVERALLDGDTHYTVRPGVPELRRSIARAVFEAGGPTPDAEDPMDNVLITSDVSESLFAVVLGLGLSPGTVVASSKGTCRHRGLFSLMGMETLRAGEATDTGLPIKLIYREWDSDIKMQKETLDAPSADDCVDVVDLHSSLWSGSLASLPPHEPRSLFVGSLDALDGLSTFRIAFLMAPSDIFTRCRTWKQALSICSAAPSQRAALHALGPNPKEGS